MRYIGSKAKVLPFIKDVIERTYGSVENSVVSDLFAGTACVAEMMKRMNARVISNDYLSFSYALQIAKIKYNNQPEILRNYLDALSILNSLPGEPGFFYNEYTLSGTHEKEFCRNYFSDENAQKIDAIRMRIGQWLEGQQIDEDMFYLLCASLSDAVTKVSNTSGTYGAFLKIDDQRKYKDIRLEEMKFYNNYKNNECFCEDIFDLIGRVDGDILYLDPPYNGRQYPPYYHILETVVKYDNPSIYGRTGRRPYQDKISPFCLKNQASDALLEIIKKANFEHVYVSYSTDGIIDYIEFCDQLTSLGNVECFFKPHRRYKSNSNNNNNEKTHLKEIIIYVQK